MPDVTLTHFERAAAEIGANGDNDTLPFDIDVRFLKEKATELAGLAFAYCQDLEAGTKDSARRSIDALPVFSERLLAPAGPMGFRTITKIHPFWNMYFNGLGISTAERLEPTRSSRTHSYRFLTKGVDLFDRGSSWRRFRESTIDDCTDSAEGSVVVQTDIASFYEHVSHHRLENVLDDLFTPRSTVPTQIDRFLSKFAAGRSFEEWTRCRT